MEQHLKKKQREEMQEIIDNMSCELDFECYKSSLENLCKVEYNAHGLFCKISKMPAGKSILFYNCEYRLYYRLRNRYKYYICTCPLRIYIAKYLKR